MLIHVDAAQIPYKCLFGVRVKSCKADIKSAGFYFIIAGVLHMTECIMIRKIQNKFNTDPKLQESFSVRQIYVKCSAFHITITFFSVLLDVLCLITFSAKLALITCC